MQGGLRLLRFSNRAAEAVAMQTGQYDVFISHAGAQKDFAFWVRSHLRICGYMAFVDERDLRCVPETRKQPCAIPAVVAGGLRGAVILY